MSEKITQKLENADSMIVVLQNDLMNEEGGCTEQIMYNALEVLRAYIENIKTEVACI